MATIHCDLCGGRLLSPGGHMMVVMDLAFTKSVTIEVSENFKSYLCDDCLDEIKEVMEERKIIYQDD